MKNYIRIYSLLIAFVFVVCGRTNAQLADYSNNKEKIYIQTSHVFFKPGDDLFFKVYVVNARTQLVSVISNVVYVEILGPSGTVLQKQNYRIEDGYAEGYYTFDKTATGGLYKIRAYTTWMLNEKESTWFTKEITLQKVISPRVLMKLDFPRKGYGPGDEVVAAYSVRRLSDKPIPGYQAKYTVSLAGKEAQTGMITTDANGKADIKFRLPQQLDTNDGLLNITITYDAYTEAISRSIPIVLNKIDLQFMPEGGTFVQGITTNIAFKAVNEFGKPADVSGQILDDQNKVITSFKSYHDGMGQVAFTPEAGRSYKAKLLAPAGIKQHFDLPASTRHGVTMNVVRKDKLLQFNLSTTHEMNVRLTGQSKGNIYYEKTIMLKSGSQTIDVDVAAFPVGIAKFTLTTEKRLPLAERVAFLHPERVLHVKITADKNKYLPREKVTLRLQTLDENNKPVPANFSLSVLDDKLWSLADDKQDHILSWLLMSTEIHGKVEEPQFYFKQDEAAAVPSLDLVMLTNGYRYFDYIDYIEKTGKPKYTADLNNVVSGIVTDKNNKPVKATVYLLSSTDSYEYKDGHVTEQVTGDDGIFFFTDISPALNYHLLARGQHTRETVNIKVSKEGAEYRPVPARGTKDPFKEEDRLPPPLLAVQPPAKPEEKEEKKEIKKDILPELGKVKQLEETVVIGYSQTNKRALTGAVSTIKSVELQPNTNPLLSLQGRVAGINITQVTGSGDTQIQIRGAATLSGSNAPLIIYNGIPIERIDESISPSDIDYVTVLKDASATALYGSRGTNGVILIEGKKDRHRGITFNLDRTFYYASQPVQKKKDDFTVARRFYAPAYRSPDTKVRDDFREVIYWNPIVQTDKHGEATVSFYNSDATTTFRAIAEGIAYNGRLGRTEMTYAVQSSLNIDAKIPPYMTIGDQALIPLVLKNNSAKELPVHITASLPANMKSGAFKDDAVIPADSSLQVLIPVTATAVVNGSIQFEVKSPASEERIALPVSVNSNGFPMITTISGNKNKKVNFTIHHMMAGSLVTDMKVFNRFEGQLLNDIESMLREPHGCFEQTSSTTYPNIYILKYLRSANQSNPEIEKKAMNYIEAGYKRLIGFETAEQGFEWFGHTPPHEALTAYGLMEFIDMNEFINVDKSMIERTMSFLLKRRDGKGNFKLRKTGYDAFASVPDRIANTYIVYALTQAGVGAEIQLEYETAVARALSTRDAYELSMMAIAASNMKDEKNFNLLMKAAKASELQSETSVVNSRAASLRVETMALYTIALTREKSPDQVAIADMVSRILAEKSYYGYGSTQATVLALQAIVEFRKLAGEQLFKSQLQIMINNEITLAGKDKISNIKEGDNTFSIKYTDEKEAVPYQLELAYYTLLPPDNPQAELKLSTKLSRTQAKVGETVRMEVTVKNTRNTLQPMSIAKIGIPGGLTVQPWQLKELMEKHRVAYYEIFDNYLVLYWMGFAEGETKQVNLDLKAEIAGKYRGKSSNTYLYYTPEYKHWNAGTEITIAQ